MTRRAALQSLLALGVAPWVGAGRAQGAERVLIRINVPGSHLLPFVPIELIPRLGIDRELGAELAIRRFHSGVQTLENMIAGDAHFAATAFTTMPSFFARGMKSVALASVTSGVAPYAVLVRNDLAAHIRSIKDLKGRSIGVPLGSSASKTILQLLMELWLDAYGVKRDEVRWVPAGMNLDGMRGALVSGSVDAVFCEEPLAGTLARKKIGTQLASLADPNNPAHFVARKHLRVVIASTPERVAANPQRAEQMVRMLQRSLAWMRQNSPEAVVAKLNLPDRELARDLAATMRRTPGLYSTDGRFPDADIEATRQFLEVTGTPLPAGIDIRSLIDDRWVRGG